MGTTPAFFRKSTLPLSMMSHAFPGVRGIDCSPGGKRRFRVLCLLVGRMVFWKLSPEENSFALMLGDRVQGTAFLSCCKDAFSLWACHGKRGVSLSLEDPEHASRKMFTAGRRGETPPHRTCFPHPERQKGGMLRSCGPFFKRSFDFWRSPMGRRKPLVMVRLHRAKSACTDTGIFGETLVADFGKSEDACDDGEDMFGLSETDL